MLTIIFKALKQSHSLYNEKPGLYGRVFCWDKCHFDQREKSYPPCVHANAYSPCIAAMHAV
jgi:hypothetical protein